jgi:hypothetical protein
MLRRSSPFLVLGMIAVVASCDSLTGSGASSGTPVGIALLNARTKGSGYTTSPKLNFYSVGSATFSFSTINSDTCLIQPYDSTATNPNTSVQLGAGAFLLAAVSGDTDSLYKAASGDQTYLSRHASGMPFTAGDSIAFNVAGDVAGFPAMAVRAKTAEPFTITRPVIPPANTPMIVNWTPATDNNAAMYISLLFNAPANNALHGSGLNTQAFCDFHDDGQGTVQSTVANLVAASSQPFVIKAQRVRTTLAVGTTLISYLNVISTFEVPTPVSP